MTETLIKAIIGAVVTASWGFCVWLVKRAFAKQKETEARQEAVENGLQSLLRAEIIRTYEKSMDRGYIPIYSREAFHICYDNYHRLGGNGAITTLAEQINALPSSKPRQ